MSVILLYHGIAKLVLDDQLQVRRETVLRHLDWCRALGFNIVSMAKALESSSERLAAVTFDDGLSTIAAVLGDLTERGVKPTAFLCPGRVGQANSWASPGRLREPLLGLEEIRSWKRLGVEFSCHGWDHRPFVGRDSAELLLDLDRCRQWFESEFGDCQRVFAWPYGRCDDISIQTVRMSGYAYALGTAPCWNQEVTAWTIPRVIATEAMSLVEFAAAIDLCSFTLDDPTHNV